MTAPARGYRGRGRGSSTYLQAAEEWRSTTIQACGLWPFAAGTGTPVVGVPVGRHLTTGATLCADPISYFQRARLVSNPSAFCLGLPGLGKSTLVRRIALGLAGYGTVPLILGDLKGEHVPLVRALGGDVIELGRGRGRLNVLDAREAQEAAGRLTGQARAAVLADALGRRHAMVCSLVTILRAAPPELDEETLLERAVVLLDERHQGVPVLADLVALIEAAPDELRQLTRDRGDVGRYHDAVDPLVKSLVAMLGRGRVGELFSEQTTTVMRRDRPVVFDLSSVDDGQAELQRAALLACWSCGFGSVAIGHALADAGIEPRRHHLLVLDELWRALRTRGLADRVDSLSRLNRTKGVGVLMVSHTMSDLKALPEEDRQKARGLVERAGMVFLGGLPEAELPMVAEVVALTSAERSLLTSWITPPSWDGGDTRPPGQGKFLLKVGNRPGIPFRLDLTSAEDGLNDTSARWHS